MSKNTAQKEIKERPILMSTPMAKATWEGLKTHTRRVIKFKPLVEGLNFNWTALEIGLYMTNVPHSGYVLRARNGAGVWEDKTFPIHCPYGKVGDRLWVRESFMEKVDIGLGHNYIEYKAGGERWQSAPNLGDQKWKSSIHMPRWASRSILEIVNIRAERARDISEADAIAEGVEPLFSREEINGQDGYKQELDLKPMPYKNYLWKTKMDNGSQHSSCKTARESFMTLWHLINGAESRETNPYVWVVGFKKV